MFDSIITDTQPLHFPHNLRAAFYSRIKTKQSKTKTNQKCWDFKATDEPSTYLLQRGQRKTFPSLNTRVRPRTCKQKAKESRQWNEPRKRAWQGKSTLFLLALRGRVAWAIIRVHKLAAVCERLLLMNNTRPCIRIDLALLIHTWIRNRKTV